MIKKLFFVFLFFFGFFAQAQKTSKEFRSKIINVQKDTIQLDSISINPANFKVFTSDKKQLSTSEFQVDFSKAQLIINSKKYSDILVEYYRYPEFITKTYTPFDKKLIVPNTNNNGQLYSLTTNKNKEDIKLFDGLNTQGFIARGITVGNNQNAVTNSSLDLNISGKLSDKVGIRANIFDTNIPLQQNGYSQNVTDFDRIFIEMFSENWRVKAGDVSLKNDNSYFLNFEKQVAGVEVEANLSDKTTVSASGAVVRGRFSAFDLVGIEGNQGPYKLLGPNNEPAIVIVSGSDKVFVNGIQLNRGETKDYVIDYNIAEIRFNTRYPITNDMRIRVEFQYSDRNYTRFITYEKAEYKSDNFSISGHFYNENDAKNQPLQQSLTDDQKQILANAGNDTSLMVSESAFLDEYSPNRIQYKKTIVGAVETFEHSTNENDELYTVTFTNVGTNQGDYVIDNTIAIGTIFRYAGNNAGNYNPIVKLIAPTSLQIFDINASYNPTEKTTINAELAYSNNDSNLFSSINDSENKRFATKINWQQVLIDKKWQLKSDVDYKYIQDNFTTVQRFQNVEFNRDWNLVNPTGNQHQIGAKFILQNKKNDFISYGFHHLNFADNFNGSKHEINSQLKFNKTTFSTDGSLLNNTSLVDKDNFFRLKSTIEHSFGKPWAGAFINFETNERKDKNTDEFSNLSHQFKEYETYVGVGDSTKIFTKIGFNYRTNDSVKSNSFTQINNRKTFYIDSKIIQNKTTNLSLYANYRLTENAFAENEKSLNSKIIYNQQFFNNFLNLGTTYETSSGNIARQDYVYVKTEPGQGFYTWIDYNNDGIQQFEEFEIAQFQDQADYLRVALPNLRYVPTQRAKWKQSISLNPASWANKTGVKKTLSHFYNQTYLLIDNEQQRVGDSFNLNPFDLDEDKLLALAFNFRNSLYFNRNLQNYSLTYTYGNSRNKQQYNVGNQENNTFIHQLELQHKLSKFWVFDFKTATSENKLETENFANRNYTISSKEIAPKFTFLYNKDHRFSIFYEYVKKENSIEDFEELNQQQFGASYFFISKKRNQISADITMFLNDFTGNANSPVGYQMLEGLQIGRNYTWNMLFNQKLNSYLNLNLNYLGRKSENSKTIHTGMVQLKAIF
ncbi:MULTISPECIES: hypothetical protein [Tenacibaculum]|uniref:hypothetical protein n=1 Tax=Tenacibaculum TaxID=104267 RepID=UPI001F0ADA99|nr:MULTISPECIES: hypothetical protein [Tenacibaculum]MCH3881152.1 hypothetical protein [Tenacibaculum aquimarinum]MDO6599248.1 hypothetical protein [Tenacibaculum sp. 1_MG-2023]